MNLIIAFPSRFPSNESRNYFHVFINIKICKISIYIFILKLTSQ